MLYKIWNQSLVITVLNDNITRDQNLWEEKLNNSIIIYYMNK